DGGLGTINWYDPQASSLSELVTDMAQALDEKGGLMDEQIATALLTGIVSETGRFSNDRTSSQTMSASAALLSAGANQQLVASKLEEGLDEASGSAGAAAQDQAADAGNGELDIDHTEAPKPAAPPPPPPPPEAQPPEPQAPPEPEAPASNLTPGPKMVTEPPKLGGTLTANSEGEHLDPVTDPMSMPRSEPPALLDHKPADKDKDKQSKPTAPPPAPSPRPSPPKPEPPKPTPPPPAPTPPPPVPPPAGKPDDDDKTLADIEKSVASPHSATLSELEAARGEVDKALTDSSSDSDGPIEALNAQPLGEELHEGPAVLSDAKPPVPPADDSQPAPADKPKPDSSDDDSDSPPPVPPPIPFQFGNSPPPQQ
ncbi:MAG TPA: hypothetical protein VFX84_00155, partial [Candidatus Saccharimonadales bacterium]|nr:hypothetical protein [Candidatus Saccharimonadales bacterium]